MSINPSIANPPPDALQRYRIVGLLARGGMAEVFLAVQAGQYGFQRLIVIKRILPHLASDPTFVQLFIDEARLVAKIRHPNVVQVTELGRTGDELFLAMEYIEGETVGRLREQLTRLGRPLPFHLAAHVAACACAGLHAAHELKSPSGETYNLVHRDVSPQNLLVTYDGSVKVVDFGVARANNRASLTEPGQLKGKSSYMSPEQCRGRPLDRRTDVFSLGIVLWELATGERLFRREGMVETLKAIVNEPIPLPSSRVAGFPPELERIIMKALSKAPADRYETAADMRRDLVAFIRATSDGMADDELSQLVQELFAEEHKERREVLDRLREESPQVGAPAFMADASTDVSGKRLKALSLSFSTAMSQFTPSRSHPGSASLVTGSATLTQPQPVEPPADERASSRAGRLGILALALVGALSIGYFVMQSMLGGAPEPVSAPTAPPDPAQAARVEASEPAPAPSPPAPPETVDISVQTQPPGAEIRIDGVSRGRSPVRVALTRADEPVRVEARLAGHRAYQETIRPNAPLQLRIVLVAADPPQAERAPARSHAGVSARRPTSRAQQTSAEGAPPPARARSDAEENIVFEAIE